MYTQLLATTLMLASSTTIQAPAFEVADVEVEAGPMSTHLLAFDADGEVAAELVVWSEPDGAHRLDITFADGLYLSARRDGDLVTIDSDNPSEVAVRARVIGDGLANASMEEMECGAALVGLLVGCGAGGPWGCLAGAAVAGVYCGPLIADELR
jgi:hypothetical protein